MIICRTPLRISFCGGGSDLPSYYRYSPGAVVSTTINKYIYITVNKKFDNKIRASYSITEFVDKPRQLKHELIREALLLLGLDGGIEITSIADIPSRGTGLGSSSSYTVGLLNALHAYRGDYASAEKLATEACQVEIDRCHKPIGKQDQYAVAYGNLNYVQFNCDESVSVSPIICQSKLKLSLKENLLMLYTGQTRSASSVLEQQSHNTRADQNSKAILAQMVGIARALKESLEKNRLNDFGDLLHQNWELKKKLADNISNPVIDRWYSIARQKGAIGGKILGAGGGGFLLLYAPKAKHRNICRSLSKLKPFAFGFDPEGSKIIYYGER